MNRFWCPEEKLNDWRYTAALINTPLQRMGVRVAGSIPAHFAARAAVPEAHPIEPYAWFCLPLFGGIPPERREQFSPGQRPGNRVGASSQALKGRDNNADSAALTGLGRECGPNSQGVALGCTMPALQAGRTPNAIPYPNAYALKRGVNERGCVRSGTV
jgi:hypothetical protein